MGILGPSASEKAAQARAAADAWGKTVKRTQCLGMYTYETGSDGYNTVYTAGTFAILYNDGRIGYRSCDTGDPYFLECVAKLPW